MIRLFKRKDPVCGMKEEKGRGASEHGKWFCSSNCSKQYGKKLKKMQKEQTGHGCCAR